MPTSDPNVLSYAQLESLWKQAGGSAKLAPTMAAIAEAESGGRTNALNDNPSTGDYSVGPWQINYYGNLFKPRSARYGPPSTLLASPLADAKAAVDLAAGGAGLSNWTTYTSGAYAKYLSGAPDVTGGTNASPQNPDGTYGPHHLTKDEIVAILKKYLAGGLSKAQAEAAIGFPITANTWGIFSDAAGAVTGAFKSVAEALGFVFSYRFLEILGGGVLILLGLYILAKQYGVPVPAPSPVKAAADAA